MLILGHPVGDVLLNLSQGILSAKILDDIFLILIQPRQHKYFTFLYISYVRYTWETQ